MCTRRWGVSNCLVRGYFYYPLTASFFTVTGVSVPKRGEKRKKKMSTATSPLRACFSPCTICDLLMERLSPPWGGGFLVVPGVPRWFNVAASVRIDWWLVPHHHGDGDTAFCSRTWVRDVPAACGALTFTLAFLALSSFPRITWRQHFKKKRAFFLYTFLQKCINSE